jgi:protein transport protein SEC31
MSLLKELPDKGATIAWSNVASHPNLLALGTKDSGNAGFDDYGGELELHKLDFSGNDAPSLLGKVKTTARFATLAWSELATKQEEYPYGLVAGGMGDGTVNVWDPAKLVSSHPSPQVASVQRHTGPVSGLMFNPHRSSSHLLASGGADAAVYIIALDRPDTPVVFVPAPPPNQIKHTGEVTKCAWNSQVSHILATASTDGSCIVWDLRAKKPWCELRDSARSVVSDVAWNPDQGLHLVTASGDDNNPVLKLWDLRSSTSLPLATLQGHTQGILSVAWCPTDASLLMSCAKDNRTLLWDLYNLQAVYELPSGGGSMASSNSATPAVLNPYNADPASTGKMFGGIGSASNRRYQVTWSPRIPAVTATCSFDRKVQVFTMAASSSSTGRAPRWLTRPCGASFGFGGKLVTFSKGKAQTVSDGTVMNSSAATVQLHAVHEDASLVSYSRAFESAVATKDFKSFCMSKAAAAKTQYDKSVWQFLQVIFTETAREQLLSYLGFDALAIVAEAPQCLKSIDDKSDVSKVKAALTAKGITAADAADVFGSSGSSDKTALLQQQLEAVDINTPPVTDTAMNGTSAHARNNSTVVAAPTKSKEAEALIKKALLVGNFEVAVQCCLSSGNMADALLLASCGGADLWASTQAAYFEKTSAQKPFLRIVKAIIKSELSTLVETSDLASWQETLAIVCTYGKTEEFHALCELLAHRLETEANDNKSANLCYMCAVNVSKTISIWADELTALSSHDSKANSSSSSSGGLNATALHEFVEKVTVLSQAEPDTPLDSRVSALFCAFASMLASEGETSAAYRYIIGQDEHAALLRDRLYHASSGNVSTDHQRVVPVPPFPFEQRIINVTPDTSAKRGNANTTNTNDTTQSAAVSTTDVLPPNWTQLIDPSRGVPYYCNSITGETQWERPAMPIQQQQQQKRPASMHSNAVAMSVAAAASPRLQGNTNMNTGFNQQQQHFPQQQQQQQYGHYSATGAAAMPVTGMYNAQQQRGSIVDNAMPVAANTAARPLGSGVTSTGVTAGGVTANLGASRRPSTGLSSIHDTTAVAASAYNPALAVTNPNTPVATPTAASAVAYTLGRVQAPAPQSYNTSTAVTGMPMMTVNRPLTVTPTVEQVQVVEPPLPPQPTDPVEIAAMACAISEQASALVTGLQHLTDVLAQLQMNPAESKMLTEGVKAANILFARMAAGTVDSEVIARMSYMCSMMQTRDTAGAAAIYKELVNTSWNAHKDWLKGLKHITTLARRL